MDPLACRSSFCPKCGTLLDTPNGDDITCICCGAHYTYGDIEVSGLTIRTSSHPRAEPEWLLGMKKKFGDLDEADQDDENGHDEMGAQQHRATVEEACPKCGHHLASFYTMQLRSVDEGQTVFYECLKCANKWSQHN